jgi:Cu-Zn family superoxide dismutase
MNYRLAPLAAALVLSACASTMSGPRAVAQLQSTTGNSAAGTVNFSAERRQGAGLGRDTRPQAECRARLSCA